MTETAVQNYNFEGNDVGTLSMDGEPWFVGKDIASALEYKNTKKALKDHVDSEDKIVGERNVTPSIMDSLIDKSFVPEVHAKPVGGRIRGTNGEDTREFDSQNQAERELHISRPSIRHSLQTGKATKGWNFEFINEDN